MNLQEEDFTSQLYHRELLPKVTAAEVHTLLDEAVSYITIASVSVETGKAIKSRLLFRQSLLKAFEQDWGPLNLRKKSSLTCIPFLRNITETTYLGVPVKDCFSTKIQRSLASSVPPRPMVTIKFSDAFSFFETLCNDVADIDQVLEAETSEDLSTAIWVFMSRAPQPSVYVRALAQSFLMERHTQRVLGKMTSKQFLISSISAIVLPKSPFLESTNAAVEAATGPRFHMARLYSEFDAKLGQQYLNVFRNACLNRCRTRRTLCHLILDWDALQADAEELDATLRTYTEEPPTLYASSQPTFSYPLSSWVYHHKLNQLRAIIQLGFELTIYAPDEFAGMYWYLSYVCGIHLSHIDRVTFFLQRDMGMQDAIPQEFSIEQPDLKDRAQSQKTLKNLFRIYMQLKATEALSKALHAIYIVLLRHEAIKTPPRPYSSDRLRYELRMRPFLSLSVPEPVNFEMFQVESSFSDVEDAHVLEEAAARVAEARKAWDEILKAGWSVTLENTADLDGPSQASKRESREGGTTTESEWSKGVKNIIRTCIATSISLSTLRKKLEKGGDLHEVQCTIPIPGERDCWHDWWIVPRLSNTA